MDKKTISAVILSAIILLGYQLYISKYYPEAYSGRQKTSEIDKKSADIKTEDILTPDSSGEEGKKELSDSEETRVEPKEITVETDKYVVTLSSIGGCINSIALKEFPKPGTKENLQLVKTVTTGEGICNISGLGERNISSVNYAASENANEVTFSARTRGGLEIVKRYIFSSPLYNIKLEIYIKNLTGEAVDTNYSIVGGSNIIVESPLDRKYTQIVSEVNGKPRKDNGRKGQGIYVDGRIRYSGLQNKYFSVITIPNAATKGARYIQTDNNNLLTEIEIEKFRIEPNSKTSHNFVLYAGPNDKQLFKQDNIDSALNYGFFGGISEILLGGLKFFHKVFKNWGVAIILLSGLVNLILYPLSRKSYESMKKMQDIQPHMEKLRSEHKDNPTKLNKEMMELYKKYNVNPMGGCLPLFLQIPVFIALYQALMRSLELRGAKFLWIKDLSMPDAVRLPVAMPGVGNSINMLPILMTVAMVVQQKISAKKGTPGSAQEKQQQQMMIIMPIIFLFVMYSFPSGLVLYWLVNTLLTMFEQRAIMHS